MGQKDLKKCLIDSLQMEQELYQFCVECLTILYGTHAKTAISLLSESIESYESNGFIANLSSLDKETQKFIEIIEKRNIE